MVNYQNSTTHIFIMTGRDDFDLKSISKYNEKKV